MKNNFYHPYKDEMYSTAEAILKDSICESLPKWTKDFSKEALIVGTYWWAADNHKGQTSDGYKALSILGDIYSPGRIENGPQPDSEESMVYDYINSESEALEIAKSVAETIDEKELNYSAKAAAAGKDIGRVGKTFKTIADKAAKKYGSKEAGERVAGAILAKIRKTDKKS